jgi:hypothetical protein
MPTDTVALKEPEAKPLVAGKAVPEFIDAPALPAGAARYIAPRDGYLSTLKPPGLPKGVAHALRPTSASIGALADRIAADVRRRRRMSISASLALNVVLLTFIGIYGTVQIWIPSAPGESHVVMVTPTAPLPLPELREELTAPPPIEPEVVKEPELKPEPEPEPAPQTEPPAAPGPEPEPEPEQPKPVINLAPDPVFAPPAEEERGPMIPEPPKPTEEPSLAVTESDPAAGSQSPEPAPEPLVEPGADQRQAEAAAAEEARRRQEEEAARLAAEKAAAPQTEAKTGDDAFDEEPVLGARKPLPSVDLPAGAQAAAPGASGVVAIFCPEEFKNKDKAAECAGRTDIRSGWKPGASGEDWSEAVKLLKQARQRGEGGADPSVTFTPDVARRMQRDYQNKDSAPSVLGGQRPSTDGFGGVENKTQSSDDNYERGLGRPAIGPAEPLSADQRRDRAPVSGRQIKQLEKALDEAEEAKKVSPNDDD